MTHRAQLYIGPVGARPDEMTPVGRAVNSDITRTVGGVPLPATELIEAMGAALATFRKARLTMITGRIVPIGGGGNPVHLRWLGGALFAHLAVRAVFPVPAGRPRSRLHHNQPRHLPAAVGYRRRLRARRRPR